MTCPRSLHKAYVKICPNCWEELPFTTGRSSTVAIIGSNVSGKTCFMAALVRQIRLRLSKEDSFEMSLEWEGSAGMEYFRGLERTVYHDKMLPEGTQMLGDLASVHITVRFPVRRLLTRWLRGAVGTVSLVLPDPAGEFFEHMDNVYFLNYLGNARAIILMVDPMMSEEYRDYLRKIGKEGPAYDAASAADSLRSVVTAVRREVGRRTGRLNKQLAVVLTKCDEKGMFDPDDRRYSNRFPRQGRRFDPALARDISGMVAQHMQEKLGLAEVVALARLNFQHVAFFAASALGSPPVRTEANGIIEMKLNKPEPRRVEEPLLWVLHQWGYL